jgi:hypothetical protein
MGDVERNRMSEECRQQVEKVRHEAAAKQKAGKGQDGSGGRRKKRNLSQKIDEGIGPNAKRSAAHVAKAAGTNRRYLEMARSRDPQQKTPGRVGAFRPGAITTQAFAGMQLWHHHSSVGPGKRNPATWPC